MMTTRDVIANLKRRAAGLKRDVYALYYTVRLGYTNQHKDKRLNNNMVNAIADLLIE